MRHYEILMNGCVPYFEDLKNCPSLTLTTFPKDIVIRLMELGSVDSNNVDAEDILSLIDWTKRRCATTALAQYVLESSIQ